MPSQTKLEWKQQQGYQELLSPHWSITLQPRPHYCDRGRFIAHVAPVRSEEAWRDPIDYTDGFPRYYFDEGRAKAELEAWVEQREAKRK